MCHFITACDDLSIIQVMSSDSLISYLPSLASDSGGSGFLQRLLSEVLSVIISGSNFCLCPSCKLLDFTCMYYMVSIMGTVKLK